MSEPFEARLSVDKSIVELLSKSAYQRNFSYALREMVSNAYDADATRVTIDIDRKADTIVIHDTGSGMSRQDFGYYLRIAGKRRGRLRTTRFNRRRIGQFGVGFLSIFPFCRVINIVTTVGNSSEVLSAKIPAAEFFKRNEGADVDSLPVTGIIYRDAAQKAAHFTTITLAGLTPSAKESISQVLPIEGGGRSLRITERSPLERLKWELQDELPLAFSKASPYQKCFAYAESDLVQVFLDGNQLFRNDVAGDLLDSGELSYDGVKARFGICTPWKPIKPAEMRHVKIRLNNVGVGQRSDFDIPRIRPYSHLSWLSGELHVIEGLEESISVSRDVFLNSSTVDNLFSQMAAKLRKQAGYLETVEKSRKTITKHVSRGKQKQVGATRDVVAKNVKRLEERGFIVETVQRQSSGRDAGEPVRIDRTKKTVTIVENHPSFEDYIKIADTSYGLLFKDEKCPHGEPCILQPNGTVAVYTQYPLFKSKRYGEVFEKMCILLAVAKATNKTAAEMYSFVLEQMSEIFNEY